MKKIILVSLTICFTALNAQFTLPQLPYSYEALEPYFDKQTMEIHHSKHHAAYVTNLNTEVSKDSNLANKSIEYIIQNISKYSTGTRNNAGGHYNHSMFWNLLKSHRNGLSKESIIEEEKRISELSIYKKILSQYVSIEQFKEQFNGTAKNRFGSGWAWLIVTNKGDLQICSTPNQDNPLMDIADVKGTPIIALDVWEHAYYLKYQNKRVDYINAFWNILNWDQAERNYLAATIKK